MVQIGGVQDRWIRAIHVSTGNFRWDATFSALVCPIHLSTKKNCLFRKHCRKSTVNNYNIMSLTVYIFHILKIGFPNTKSSEHRLGKEENIAAYLYLSVECRTIYTFFTVGSVTMG